MSTLTMAPTATTTTTVVAPNSAPTTPSTTTPTTPTIIRTSDCRKFSPNIFNKSKCSHCFRQREEHSAAALECNRASRKVSKCGYLFVAPDWDFSNPLYRTKRWQRRWFVLYDDGELTYSVDEHPETVPQACIDMTKVLEVTTAEDVTGHLNSIAITAPDRVTFVKGTCPEESKWWLNILAAFPKSKGRHKRNATFPGGQATTILQSNAETSATIDGIVVQTRNRHNSYHKDPLTSAQSTGVLIGSNHSSKSSDKTPATWKHGELVTTSTTAVSAVPQAQSTKTAKGTDVIGNQDDEEDDGVETGEDEDDDDDNDDDNDDANEDVGSGDEVVANTPASMETNLAKRGVGSIVRRKSKMETTTTTSNSKNGTSNSAGGQDENNRNAGNEITNRVSQSCLLIEDISRDEKTIKDIANTITNLSQHQKHRWSTTTAVNNVLNSHLHLSTTGTTSSHTITNQQQHKANNGNSNNKDSKFISRDEIDFQRRPASSSVSNIRPKSLPLAANSTPAIVSAIVKKIPPVLASSSSAASTTSVCNAAIGDGNNNDQSKNNSSNNGSFKSKSSPRLQLQLKHLQQIHQSNQQRQQKHLQQQQQQQQRQRSHERGDPDGGCNLDDLSSHYLAKTDELRVNAPTATPTSPLTTSTSPTKLVTTTSTPATLPAAPLSIDESLDAKKGWLMKQDNRTADWTKHWFTLSGAALFYYRDPVSEERGVLDGVLDVNSLTNVAEVNANRNYAFQLTTWDKRRLTLASLSPNSRNSWIAVLRSAAGLKNGNPSATHEPSKGNENEDMTNDIEKDFINAQRNHELIIQSYPESNNNISQDIRKSLPIDSSQSAIITSPSTQKPNIVGPMTPSTPKSAMHLSSDEEYRTASEGGRRDSIDWGSPQSPSPPIPPASLIRAKDRMRTRNNNCPRLHKRSRSSPPSSRRSTIDSVGSDELPPIIHTVQEELSIDKELQFRLSNAEKEREILRTEAKERELRLTELLTTLERTEQELTTRIEEMENVRSQMTSQLEDAKQNAAEIVDRLSQELEESQKKIRDLEDRLARGIDENEALYKRLRELESCSPSSFSNLNRSKIKRMDSLSDLTQISEIDPYGIERDALAEEYKELRIRFEKAVNEIKAMKRELKESQNQFDSLEISYAALKQDMECKELEDRSQMHMMAERIQDLTLKYSSSERQVRTLKQKLAKSERRRSLSLKGKEQLTVPKELEVKVSELETKIDEMEKSTHELKSSNVSITELNGTNCKLSAKKSTRRRSLESTASADSLQFVVSGTPSSSSTPTPSTGTPSNDSAALRPASQKMSEHLIDRLRCLESVLIASKDRLEQSLQQLQNLRSTRTRRSVSPITDRKDSYRFLERCLAEVIKLIRESCETCIVSGSCSQPNRVVLLPEASPVKVALTQLETQLRNKLADLLKQRRMLRERNELTKCKDLELLAERIAFESVCFGRLRESVARAESFERLGEHQTRAEVAETSHLMSMLKAKLSGKCALKPSGSVDILAGVLARRLVLSTYRRELQSTSAVLEPVDQNILDELLRQQQELNVIAKRYKNNAMETLAAGLAAETLSFISSNDLVQGAVQEAWRQAQETVNAELVQSEIAHIMMRSAERFEQSVTPAFGYTLTAEERLSFEKFADAVHDALRKEMEMAAAQLTHCYEEAIQQMKRGQWRLHLEHERKASESRHLLAEFADILAHKALVDARISVLRGEYVRPCPQRADQDRLSPQICVTALQKYEELFEELSGDLQINNPDDILAEADFEFMYKQKAIEFFNDRQTLADISAFLGQLEDSLIALQSETLSPTTVPRTAISIESLQDVCQKCCELRQRADQLLQDVHRKLSAPCSHCLQNREKVCELQHQHENEMVQLKQSHAKDVNSLLQELEHQRTELQCLEKEKHAINSDLHRSEELIEERERELDAVNRKLKTKEGELKCKQAEQLELLRRLEQLDKDSNDSREKSEALAFKCARQDEEYVVLLQVRDQLQSELAAEKERSRRLEKRLEMLEVEHTKQLECLQEAYRDQILSHCSDFTKVTDEESFRQRYQTEIVQLRTLCEKGLSAMESSHRRTINDLEEKHKQEIERLLVEKETALAEETQATLAALDAMRKAHQSEVQREVARFKQEFLRQFQQGEHPNYDASRFKEEELEDLRQEILSFSEKYSIKCVENAALEEKLRAANQKLRHLQQMQQFELRNKQFRAHLAAEDPTNDASFVQGLATTKDVNDEGTACGLDSEV